MTARHYLFFFSLWETSPLWPAARGRATPTLARPLAALGLLLATASAAQAQTTTNFTYTAPGSPQSYTVPAGITKLNVVATGGCGGNRGNNKGGLGAVVQATVTVVPGEVLTVVMGGRGADSNNNGSSSVGGAGGYNGGATAPTPAAAGLPTCAGPWPAAAPAITSPHAMRCWWLVVVVAPPTAAPPAGPPARPMAVTV